MAADTTTPRPLAPSLDQDAFTSLSAAGQISAIRGGATRAPFSESLRLILMLGRPRTCIPGLFAYALAVGEVGAPFGPLLLLGAVLSFLVGFSANLHNTYTDLEEDSRNLPGRMWLVYRLGHRRLRNWLIGLNAFMAASALLYGPDFFVFTVVGLVGLHQYSFPPARLKSRPLLGLSIFAMATVGPFLIGWFGLGGGVRLPDTATWSVIGFLFVWFIAKGLFKNTPDYYGDKAAGLRTSASVFPTWRGAALTTAAGTIAAYLCYPALVLTGAFPPVSLAALGLLPLVVVQLVRLVRAEDGAVGNDLLRKDMLLSSAFLGASLVLAFPTATSAAFVLTGVGTIILTDALNMDSRRSADAATDRGDAPEAPEPNERPRTPQELFHRVARYYDTLNSAFSLGFDRSWRRRTAAVADIREGERVLDAATGTGALARALLHRSPSVSVVGCDINTSMLAVARRRLERWIAGGRCELVLASADDLPFPDRSFDVVSIAFAIDDMPDRERAVRELRRVLRPNGRLVLLELSVPDRPVARRLYLTALGLFALLKGSRAAGPYAHLREEIVHYRGAEAIGALLASAGLHHHRHTALTGGIARLHIAEAGENRPTAQAPSGDRPCR